LIVVSSQKGNDLEETGRTYPDPYGNDNNECQADTKKGPLIRPDGFFPDKEMAVFSIATAKHAYIDPLPVLIRPDKHRTDRIPYLAHPVTVW
jgi:hypothetical protein